MGRNAIRSPITKQNYKYIILFCGLAYISGYLIYVNNTKKGENTTMYITLDKCKSDLTHKMLVNAQESRMAADEQAVSWEQFSVVLRGRRDCRTVHTRPDPPVVRACEQCEAYDILIDPDGVYECLPVKTIAELEICLYDDEKDTYISKSIRDTGMWEGNMVREFQLWLQRDIELGVIDVGCNIGLYTLTAAGLNHDVISVEPYTEHIKRLHKSINLAQLQHRITVLRNAVSDVSGHAEVHGHTSNQGATAVKQDHQTKQLVSPPVDPSATGVVELTQTITLNDLVPYCAFHRAILKLNIADFQHRAFSKADHLFKEVFMPVVMMEWADMNALYWLPVNSNDRRLVEDMIEFLLQLDYTPIDWNKSVLHVQMWDMWPKNILWVHKTFRL